MFAQGLGFSGKHKVCPYITGFPLRNGIGSPLPNVHVFSASGFLMQKRVKANPKIITKVQTTPPSNPNLPLPREMTPKAVFRHVHL